MLADEALFQFETGELVRGELTGSPIRMSDFVAEQNMAVTGTAESISYDARTGSVRLTGQVTLVIGDDEYRGCDLFYNFNDKT